MPGLHAVDEIIQLAKRCRFTRPDPSAATRSVGRSLEAMECPMKRLFALWSCRFSQATIGVALSLPLAAAGAWAAPAYLDEADVTYVVASETDGDKPPAASVPHLEMPAD